MRIFLILLIVASWPSVLTAQKSSGTRGKLVALAKEGSGDSYHILTHVGNFRFQKYLDARSQKGILEGFNTVVHESTHALNDMIGDKSIYGFDGEGYFITKGVEIVAKKGLVYNAIKLNSFVPKDLQKKIFRYDTYVGGPKKIFWVSSQSSGIYGMVNEFAAYYHGTKASMELFEHYFKICDGFEDEICWLDYVGGIASTSAAYYEFKLFISWYLQFAKKKYPSVFESCMNNIPLRLAYTLIDDLFGQLVNDYYTMLDELIIQLNKEGEKVALEEDDGEVFITVYKKNGSYSGRGTNEDMMRMLRQMLDEEQHDLLKTFRIEGATLENYKSFLKN